MNTDNFSKNDSIKKRHSHVHGKNLPSKHINKSCHRNLGNFVFNTQCCSNDNPDSNDCCNDKPKKCINLHKTFEGRLLFLHVNLKDICPNKTIVVSVLIYENDKLYAYKVKKMFTGSLDSCKCKEFDAGKFCFVIQENCICNERKFKAKVIYNYTEC
ncbi:hypothetical protein Ccar_17390 [Clostridium carboxidivorans P7]|uniref:Uncharacterized protein n=1 Tax=Clostridium carboxidivorans P7 TaxID=536227 RepID=C6PW14_9CLOT|nr:hypothetical protein [Clostridium carboxidivorans]AKN32537.1 hypothetical protein Ccar_17390 [Clostridium carboxidivorans P7]EET86561.1 hypothetical protein CcarbDRAFT_2981 [Clostridium carboxidivorans P7]EFG87735.1 hypothetical protein CLCAR_2586 [Clostridium carboxidivorans P7]